MSRKIYSILKLILLISVLSPISSIAADKLGAVPHLSLVGLDGKIHQLSEWQNKIIVLNFWATYCIPCKNEIKELIKYQQKYANKGLQVVGIGINEEQSIKTMSLLLGINYPVLLADIEKNGNEAILKNWGNSKSIVPYTIVIDSTGMISYRHGGILKPQQFEKNILPLLDPMLVTNSK